MNPSAPPPAWFDWAMARPGVSRHFDAAGTRLHYLAWNERRTDLPGLVLAHGYLAHAHWWNPLAPFFADRYRVAALDFGGMGDSGARPAYSPLGFAQELLALIDHLGLGMPTVVGHSFGGGRALRAAAEAPEAIGHLVLVDSHINLLERDGPRQPIPAPSRSYPDVETALARFRLFPPQDVREPAMLDHVARHSLRPAPPGWSWKFDPAVVSLLEDDGEALLRRLRCRLDVVVGSDSSVVDAARARRIAEVAGQGRGPVVIPHCGHHVMLDQPLALVAALNALLA